VAIHLQRYYVAKVSKVNYVQQVMCLNSIKNACLLLINTSCDVLQHCTLTLYVMSP